jgi:hypothetical protein
MKSRELKGIFIAMQSLNADLDYETRYDLADKSSTRPRSFWIPANAAR